MAIPEDSLAHRLSNSKVKTWRRCPKKFDFKYVRGLRPKERKLELERGTWIHDLLQTHYDGEDWKARHKHLSREFYRLFEEEREMLGDLPRECARIMLSYLRRYSEEDRQYRVVDSELDEYVMLPNGLRLQIIVDLILEDESGGLWAMDHKTRKNFADAYDMMQDPQLSLYFWGLEKLGYKKMRGVIYNEICTKPPTVPKLTKTGKLERRKNIVTDVYTYMREIRRHGLDPGDYTDILRHIALAQKDRWFLRTTLPKDPPVLRTMVRELVMSAREIRRAERTDEYPRTFIPKSCRWDCEYKDLCITELHGGDIDPLVKAGFKIREKRRDEDEPKKRLKV